MKTGPGAEMKSTVVKQEKEEEEEELILGNVFPITCINGSTPRCRN